MIRRKIASWPAREQANVRLILLMLACFFLGIAVGGVWFYRSPGTRTESRPLRQSGPPPLEAPQNAGQVALQPPGPAPAAPVATPQPDEATVRDVKRLIPNLERVSVKEGIRILRDAALKEFQAAAKVMQQRTAAAEEQIRQDEGRHSDAEQQDAIRQLQQLQSDQDEEFKRISARLQAEITALKQMKQ